MVLAHTNSVTTQHFQGKHLRDFLLYHNRKTGFYGGVLADLDPPRIGISESKSESGFLLPAVDLDPSTKLCENIIIQWNPGLTICQGDVKIISLNRDIVIPRFPV